jgi:histidinol-phosphate aminotransferase
MPHHIPRISRRSFLQGSTLASAAVAFRVVTEPMLAHAALPRPLPDGTIKIDANENPLGPCEAARSALSDVIPQGGRYSLSLTDELTQLVAEQFGLPPDHVAVFPGSSAPLHYSVLAFTSATRSYVTADPGYEAGMEAAKVSRARVVKVPLTKTYAHDLPAMLAAGTDAGLFYICTPNNPTGTLTSHADIEFAVEHKPKGSILLIDEAYIHFTEAPSALHLVKAGHDVIVLRTFSKIYGMAGLRCGLAMGRPDLIEKLHDLHGWNAMPVTAVVAAIASLRQDSLVPERRRINTTIREKTFEWLGREGYRYIPSQTNFFLLDTGRAAKPVIEAMLSQHVAIGRVWPAMPTYTRISIGTGEEMTAFQAAFKKVMDGTITTAVPRTRERISRDGIRLRA